MSSVATRSRTAAKGDTPPRNAAASASAASAAAAAQPAEDEVFDIEDFTCASPFEKSIRHSKSIQSARQSMCTDGHAAHSSVHVCCCCALQIRVGVGGAAARLESRHRPPDGARTRRGCSGRCGCAARPSVCVVHAWPAVASGSGGAVGTIIPAVALPLHAATLTRSGDRAGTRARTRSRTRSWAWTATLTRRRIRRCTTAVTAVAHGPCGGQFATAAPHFGLVRRGQLCAAHTRTH